MSGQSPIIELILWIQHQKDQIKPDIKRNNKTLIILCCKLTKLTVIWHASFISLFFNFYLFFYLESRVWGSWIFSTVVILGSHCDLTGLAAARIDVLAFSWQMMPALAMDNVCCSLKKKTKKRTKKKSITKVNSSLYFYAKWRCQWKPQIMFEMIG